MLCDLDLDLRSGASRASSFVYNDADDFSMRPFYIRSDVLNFKKIEKINATASQPQRNVLKYFAIFKNVAHILEPGETPSYSASHQAPNYVQRS